VTNDLIGLALPRDKTCSCGRHYTAIPGRAAVTREGHLFFDCPSCKSTMLLRDYIRGADAEGKSK
jgi:hypothetical protein